MLGRLCCAALLVVAACGKPVDASGKEDSSFTKAGMGLPQLSADDPNRPLAADLAVEPVSMLVMFNRLHTSDKLAEALNKTPGQFSKVDVDRDNTFDPLSVKMQDAPDGHTIQIHAKPPAGEYIVATMLFDSDWQFVGHYNGLKGGGASTVGLPLLATGVPGPLPIPVATSPTPTPVTTTPPPSAAPPAALPPAPSAAAAGSIAAVPADSAQDAGLKPTP